MERLSGHTAGFLARETAATPLHVCTLVELAPASGPEQPEQPAGYSFDSVRDSLRELVGAEPVLRRKLFDNFFNLDHPVWVDDRQFDIDRHLHRVAVPAPGHDADLAQLVGHLAGQPLDRGRPLWEVWVIEGRSNGSIAVLAKTHLTGDYADIQPTPATDATGKAKSAVVPTPTGGENPLELVVGGLFNFATRPIQLAGTIPGTIASLPAWFGQNRRRPARVRAPRSCLNATITGRRSVAFHTFARTRLTAIAQRYASTEKAGLLALVGTALRMYLEDRGELPLASLIAGVPGTANELSCVPLRTELDDPAERIDAITAYLAAVDATDQPALTVVDTPQAARTYAAAHLAERLPGWDNLLVAELHDPGTPTEILGLPVRGIYVFAPVLQGAGLAITTVLHRDRCAIAISACTEIVPDPWSLAGAVDEAIGELSEVATPQAHPPAALSKAGNV